MEWKQNLDKLYGIVHAETPNLIVIEEDKHS